MLLYIYGKGKVRKNRVVRVIELRFTLLSQDSDLIITAPTTAAADDIGSSTIHTSLDMGIRNQQGKLNAILNLISNDCGKD